MPSGYQLRRCALQIGFSLSRVVVVRTAAPGLWQYRTVTETDFTLRMFAQRRYVLCTRNLLLGEVLFLLIVVQAAVETRTLAYVTTTAPLR